MGLTIIRLVTKECVLLVMFGCYLFSHQIGVRIEESVGVRD